MTASGHNTVGYYMTKRPKESHANFVKEDTFAVIMLFDTIFMYDISSTHQTLNPKSYIRIYQDDIHDRQAGLAGTLEILFTSVASQCNARKLRAEVGWLSLLLAIPIFPMSILAFWFPVIVKLLSTPSCLLIFPFF